MIVWQMLMGKNSLYQLIKISNPELICPDSLNTMKIPRAQYITSIEQFIHEHNDVSQTILYLEKQLDQYNQMYNRIEQQKRLIINNIPSIKETLEAIQHVAENQNYEFYYQLMDGIYSKGKVVDNKIALFLGSNVIVEYTVEEALKMMQDNYDKMVAQVKDFENNQEFLKEQQSIIEVSVSRKLKEMIYKFPLQIFSFSNFGNNNAWNNQQNQQNQQQAQIPTTLAINTFSDNQSQQLAHSNAYLQQNQKQDFYVSLPQQTTQNTYGQNNQKYQNYYNNVDASKLKNMQINSAQQLKSKWDQSIKDQNSITTNLNDLEQQLQKIQKSQNFIDEQLEVLLQNEMQIKELILSKLQQWNNGVNFMQQLPQIQQFADQISQIQVENLNDKIPQISQQTITICNKMTNKINKALE